MRVLARVATAALTGVLSLGVLAAPAHAASPVRTSSSPADGALLRTAPTTVSVSFDQSVAAQSTLTVAGPSGASPCTTTTTTPTATITCTFTGVPSATVPDGSYTATYNARSTGTDPATAGSFGFVVDTVAPPAPTGLTASPSPYVATSDTLTVTGTTQAATDTVRVALTGGATRTVTPAADRSFSAVFSSADVRATADGTVTVTATSTDAAGNTGTAATRTLTKDTVRPSVTASTPAAGGASNASPFVYDVTTSEAIVQSAPATTIRLFDDTGTELAATVTYPSATSVRATPSGTLPQGAYTARIFLTDLNANTNNPSPEVRTFTLDRTAPAGPVLTTPLAAVSKANASAWPVSGTGEARAQLTVTASTSAVATVTRTITVAADGTWSTTLDLTGLAEGTVSVTARQSDAAGNVSPVSATATTSKDTVSPTVTGATVTPQTFGGTTTTSTVSGSVNDGSVAAGAENASVQVTADDTDPATAPVVASGTSPAGSFSIPVNTATLSDGTLTYRIVATDASGNASATVTVTNTKDTAAPAAPSVTFSPARVSNATKAAVTVSGSATGSTVRIVLSDNDPATADLVQGATVTNGTYTSTFDTTGLTDGTLTAAVTTTDTAGNVSASGTATAPKDTVAPIAPTDLVVPTFVTSGSLPVSGRAEAGTTVRVTVTDGATPAATASASATVAADGTWSLTVDVTALAQGTLSVAARATDAAGNTGPAASTTTTKDSVAPDQPATVTVTPATYVPSSTTLTVSGTTSTADRATSDLRATIVVSDAATPPATITAVVPVTPGSTSGTFSHAFTREQVLSLADGPLSVSVTLRDAAGNVGPARTTTATKDAVVLDVVSTTPAADALVSMPPSASVTFNEAITPTTDPAATRSTIAVTNRNGVTLAGTASVSGRTLTFTPSSPFTEAGGPFTVTYRGVDAALTSETRSGSFLFSVDNTPPAAPVITSVTDPVNRANQTAVVVSGTAETGAPVRVVVAGTIAVTTTATDGTFRVTLDLSSLADGVLAVGATQQDPAGNTSAAATTSTRKDTTTPTLASAVPAPGSTVTPPATVRLTFSEDLGSATVSIPGVTGTTAVSGRTATFTPASPLADGTYTATASVTDTVGNPGTGSTTFTVDGTAPAAPAVTSVTDPVGLADQGAVVVTGTAAEPGARIVVTLAGAEGTGPTATTTATTTAAADGTWRVALDATSLPDGTLRASATESDALGNTSGPGTSLTTTKDTVRPSLVSATPADGSTVAAPTSIRFTFSEALGSGTVTVTRDGSAVAGTSTVSGSTVTFTPGAPPTSGAYTATAAVTDTAGNPPTTAPTTTFTVDATGPAVTDLAATPATAAADRTTVTGRTEPGARVVVTVTDGTRGATATATADDQGAFGATLSTAALADGTLTVTATATDGLGNAGEAARTTTTKDATAPNVLDLAATATDASRQSTTVTGTRSESSAVELTATLGSRTATATVPAGTGSFRVDLDLSGFPDGVVTVTATATDAAGNTGPRAETTAPRDATRPVVTDLGASDTSSTRQTTTVTGTRSETSSVTVEVSDGTSAVVRTVPSGDGGFSVDLDLSVLGDGPLSVTATATDTAGNVGAPARTTAQRDVTGPTVTDLAATATSAARQVTTVTGTRSEAGTVIVTVGDGTETGTRTADVAGGSGAFSVRVDLTGLGDGPLTVRATATDASGNVGPTAEASAVRDVTAPTVTELSASDTTRDSAVTTVTGTRSETSTVALSATDGTRTVTGAVASGTGGFTATLDLAGFTPGQVTVTARPTDTAGNVGGPATATLTHVGPRATSTTTLSVSASRVAYQASLTLRGTVTRPAGGTPGTVALTATTDGGRVVDLGTVAVAADGTFTKTLRPSVNATYRATYAGDADHTTSRSAPRRVEVAARVTARSATGPAGTAAVVSGTATAADGTTATLVRLNPSGSVTRLATTSVRSSRFTFRVRLPRGTTRLEVRVAASLDHAAGSVRLNARRT